MSEEREPTITVLAHSDDERDTSTIHGRLDPPRVVEGVLVIPGWVFGRKGDVTAVEVRDETGSVVRTSVGRPRPDVFDAVPGAPEDSGFSFSLVPVAGAGASTVTVSAELEGGRRTPLGHVDVVAATPGAEGVSRRRRRGVRWRTAARSEARPLKGEDGWLFLADDTNDVIGQHTGRVKLGRRGRRAWRRVLSARVAAARELGVTWHTLVAPDKEAVYAEFLPDAVQPAARRPVHEFLGVAATAGAEVSYPLPELRDARAEMLVYRQADTRWTDFGAYTCYSALCRELRSAGIELPALPREQLAWRREAARDDLGGKLDPQWQGWELKAIVPNRPTLVFDNQVLTHGRVVIYESRSSGPVGLVFGESFAASVIQFLSHSFRRVVYVHSSMWIREIVEVESPDVVVSLPLERFLIRVPTDGGLESLRRTIEEKVSRGDLRADVDPSSRDSSHVGRIPSEWDRSGASQAGSHAEPTSLATASFEELRALGMSMTQATRVLRARESGELRSPADLAKVPGFPERLRTELEGRITD